MEKRRCDWEACAEDATRQARWRRDPDSKVATYDFSHYCEAHLYAAVQNGAVEIKNPLTRAR